MKRLLLALILAFGVTSAAKADHYHTTADPRVIRAFNEIIGVLGHGCNVGNASACNAIPMVQQYAYQMLSAGHECSTGNQQACGFYQQNLWELNAAYQQLAAAMQQGHITHAERMRAIHNFGEQNRANFNNRMATMDSNHQQFLEYIRQ